MSIDHYKPNRDLYKPDRDLYKPSRDFHRPENDFFSTTAPNQHLYRTDHYARNNATVQRLDAGIGIGIVGALAFNGKAAVLGAGIAKAGAAAGISTIAGIGAVPVAGALLLGGAAIVGATALAAVAGPAIGKGVYNGIKSTLGAVGKGLGAMFGAMSKSLPSMSNYSPARSQSQGLYAKATQENNKAAKYLKGTKGRFEKGENTQKELQQISELKGLSRSQKKELSNQMGDNFIKSAAENNGRRITTTAIAQQVVSHANEHGLTKTQARKLYNDAICRFEQHKDMQNITGGGQVMKDAFSNMNIKAKSQTGKPKPKTSAPAKVQGHTQSVGKHIVSANNAQYTKAAQPQQSKSQSSQSSSQAKSSNTSQGRGGRE